MMVLGEIVLREWAICKGQFIRTELNNGRIQKLVEKEYNGNFS